MPVRGGTPEWRARRAGALSLTCEVCGQPAASVTETKAVRRLCEPEVKPSRRYEPCGCVVDLAEPVQATQTVTEYGVRYPDGHVETDWGQTLEAARDEAEETSGAVVVTRTVTSTPWTEDEGW